MLLFHVFLCLYHQQSFQLVGFNTWRPILESAKTTAHDVKKEARVANYNLMEHAQ